MKVTENSIIPIYQDRAIDGELTQEQYVNAKDLKEYLQNDMKISEWVDARIKKYGYIEGKDFFRLNGKSTGGRPATDYIFTMDASVEIASGENSEQGRFLRRYLWEAVKRNFELEKIRLKAKTERRVLTDIIKELVPESPHKAWVYKHYTDLVYKVVTGYTAKELRAIKGLDEKANIRPYLSEDEIAKVIKFERVIQGLLALGMSYDEIKNVVINAASGKGAFLTPKAEDAN